MPSQTQVAAAHLSSQCSICGTVLSGALGLLFKVVGIRRSKRNPNVCSRCNTHIRSGKMTEITVLFADLSSFTELTQKLGAARTHEIVDAFLKMATDILHRHGATIDKYVGDAVMALFNIPATQTDHPHRAVQSAMDLQACMPLLESKHGIRLQASVGIASGWAYVGKAGSRDEKDWSVIGDSVNLAARLQTKAGAGQVLVTQGVYAAVKDMLISVQEETVALKGFADPVVAYRFGGDSSPKAVVEEKPESLTGRKTLSVGALIFSVLGAPCAVASLLGPLAFILGAGWLIGVIGVVEFIDDHPWIRLPLLAIAAMGASANLYTIRHAKKLRAERAAPGESIGMTLLEKRQTLWLRLISYATLAAVLAELVMHPIFHHHFL